jgi:GT2 family glycosyltransferase
MIRKRFKLSSILKNCAFYISAMITQRLRARVTLALFDSDHYLETNQDVKASELHPFVHFLRFGYQEGRIARSFDNDWYLQKYPDVQKNYRNGYDHYKLHGRAEKREAKYVVWRSDAPDAVRKNYDLWLQNFEQRPPPRQNKLQILDGPKISVLMATYNSNLEYLSRAIESVMTQSYDFWELCIADDASTDPEICILLQKYASLDPRVKYIKREINGHISEATNSALELATGKYVGLLDHDDLLAIDALEQVAEAVTMNSNANVIYSDEDKIDSYGRRFDPHFKSDFNYELFLAQNMISHFGVYRRATLEKLGGFRKGFEGAQDYDIALRVIEQSGPNDIIHIPKILYHWRAVSGSTALSLNEKSYASAASLNAIREHLQRVGKEAQVVKADLRSGHNRIIYKLPQLRRLVSIIIVANDYTTASRCVNSLVRKTTYQDYEIILVDNTVSRAGRNDLKKLESDRLTVVKNTARQRPSEIKNHASEMASGEYLLFLDADLIVVSEDWVREMVSFAQNDEIGGVGAKLRNADGTLEHGGIILGVGGIVGNAHRDLSAESMGYFCRAIHHQRFSAISGSCMMVKKAVFNSLGGFDESYSHRFDDIDFCLQMGSAGLRNVWTPYAELVRRPGVPDLKKTAREDKQVDAVRLKNKWHKLLQRDPFYNPNLTLEFEDFSLAWPPRTN